MAIQVINPGFHSVYQDLGRSKYQHIGLSPSTPMDEELFHLANRLVGNEEGSPCIEFFMIGPSIKANENHTVAIVGDVEWVKINNYPVSAGASLLLRKDDVLTVGPFRTGCRGYLAIQGIKSLETAFSSVAYDKKTAIGSKLIAKQWILADNSGTVEWLQLPYEALKRSNPYLVRYIKGADSERFTPEGLKTFQSSSYTMQINSNRMGIRFSGDKIEHLHSADILSRPLTKGTIQVPANGMPIVMMSDHQPTGGYTVIATVCQADLWKLAQLKADDIVSFQEISLKDAIYESETHTIAAIMKESVITMAPRLMSVNVSSKTYHVEVREIVDED